MKLPLFFVKKSVWASAVATRLRWRSLRSYLNPFCEMQQIPAVVLQCFQSICRLKDLCNSINHRGQCLLLGASSSLSPWAHWRSRSPAAIQCWWRSPGSSTRLGLASPPQLMRLSVSRSVCEIVFAGHRILVWEHKSAVSGSTLENI